MPADRLRLREIRDTSAFRLTVLLGGVFAIGLLALIGFLYVTAARQLVGRTDRILRAQAERLRAEPTEFLPGRVAGEVAQNTGFSHIALISADGERIAGDLAVDHPPRTGRTIEIDSPLGPLRVLAVRTEDGETIVVARDISQIRYLRRRILLILTSSGIAILLGTTAAAVLLSARPLRRVRDLEQAAQEIARGRFETRMPIAGRGDELDRIAGTVNLMVDEIGRVVAQVKGVTDAVAHDLRTPLAHVSAQLLDLARLPGAEAAAGRAVAELDLVLARFAALLRIAEIEAGARRAHFAPVDLTALATETIELYEPLAEERGIALAIATSGPAMVDGDRHLLIEAVSNLLDNAIKFGAARVILSVLADEAGITLAVRDDGPGIPAEERKAVLHRFHRGTNARTVPGNGLGLSIVAAVAHLHGMELRIEDGAPGLIVTLRLA